MLYHKLRVEAVFCGMHVLAIGCLLYLATHYSIAPLFSGSALFWLILDLIGNYAVIRIFSDGVPNTVSAGFTVSGAILVLFNPLVAALLVGFGTLDERDFRRLRTTRWTFYNRSMHFTCAAIAALVLQHLPGPPLTEADPASLMARMAVMSLAYFIPNTSLVRAGIAALENERFFDRYPFKGDLLLGYLFQGCLVSIGLVLLARMNEALAILIVGPLWALRFSLEKVIELREINEQLVQSFADALDLRDHDTAGHTRRVAALARLIARELHLSRRLQDDIYAAGSLHDLGKIGIPDAILLKPGSLERCEWDEMKKHPVMGASLLAPYRHLANVTAIMRHHHEKFDGTGYPDGIAGTDIPIGARVITLADTFMVITDGRQYRAARTVDEAVAEIKRCAGSQFDPQIVEAFLTLDPFTLRSTINAVDPADKRPVLRALAPNPVWARLLGFKAA